MLLVGRGHVFRGHLRVWWTGVRSVGRYPCGARPGGLRKGWWDAPWRPAPPRPDHRKGMSGLRRWSLLVLFLGRDGRGKGGEVLEQVRQVTRYLLRTVARQSEVHASQKLRRTLQLYSAYSRLWGEEAARNMLASLRRALASKGRHLLLSAVCFSNFNWDQEKISDECLRDSAKDLESVTDLCRATIECHTCGKRQVIDQKMVEVDYCQCGGSLGYTDDTREYQSWRPFIEREHHIVWRQRHPEHHHLFAYKVYGSYDDVSLSSFMETQLNTSYRTEWDDTALQLKVLNSHQESNSDLVYWLVKFPHFFANRDYLFKRRFFVNSEKREVVIMSEAVSPGVMPEEKGVHRVNEYWSTMVIRARGDVDQDGIEYTLTYFDNPGTSLPQSITNFIAMTGFPNFLKKLHTAALQLQCFHEKGEDVYVSLPAVLRYPQRQREELEDDLPEPGVPSVEVLPQDSEAVAVKSDTSKALLGYEELLGESQDEELVVSLPITSAVVVEGSVTEAERHEEEIHAEEELSVTNISREEGSDIEISTVSSVSREEISTSSADIYKGTTSDKSLHVNIGGKNISVDLLEAMEVVAPDLEKKSLLVRKIEELNENLLNDNGKQNIVLQELRKLRHKLRSFREEASMRKERSMRQMEQLSDRDHYHHMNIDDKTLTQLEVLFEAMRCVLQADKDMRTGKSLLGDSTTRSKPDEGGSPERSESDIPGQDADDQPPDGDKPENSNSKTSKKKKKNRAHKERQPPKDPPPPGSAGGEWREGETREKADGLSSEAENFANEIGSIASSVHNAGRKESESRSWFSGVSVPYISAWWDGGASEGSAALQAQPDITKPQHNTAAAADAQSNVLLSQLLYVLTLSWIFYPERDEAASPSDQKSVRSASVNEEDREGGEEGDGHSEVRWYWYPVNGAYKVYAWVFSASRVNA